MSDYKDYFRLTLYWKQLSVFSSVSGSSHIGEDFQLLERGCSRMMARPSSGTRNRPRLIYGSGNTGVASGETARSNALID